MIEYHKILRENTPLILNAIGYTIIWKGLDPENAKIIKN